MCFTHNTIQAITKENRADLVSTVLIAMAQLSLYLLVVSVVVKAWTQALVLLAMLGITSPAIYLNWFRKLRSLPEDASSAAAAKLLDVC